MEKYYSKLGRKSLDPVLLFKMLLIGYLFNVDSELELEEEVSLNIGYRWFLGFDLSDPVPDHSTFSQNRRRRFKDSTVFQEIFDHIIKLCIEKGQLLGKLLLQILPILKLVLQKVKSKRSLWRRLLLNI